MDDRIKKAFEGLPRWVNYGAGYGMIGNGMQKMQQRLLNPSENIKVCFSTLIANCLNEFLMPNLPAQDKIIGDSKAVYADVNDIV